MAAVPVPDHALTAERIIAEGGWHPAYASVPRLVTDGDVALAVVAGNGPGDGMEVELWHRSAAGWRAGTTGGFAPEPGAQLVGGNPDAVYAVGMAEDGHRSVLVAFGADVESVPVGDDGLWVWVRAIPGTWTWEMPEVLPVE